MIKTMIASIINRKSRNALPKVQLHDDLYIVEYPKSGITWLSVLIANLNLKCSGMDVKANYYNARDFVPDIHVTKDLKGNILPFPGFRFIKSHSSYNPFYNKIIYLIRDPRDVMVSYFHFTRDLNAFNGSFSQFIRSKNCGIEPWVMHVEGWLNGPSVAQFINFVRFEDMKTDARSVLKHIYKLHGISLCDEDIDYAVDASSFSEMKSSEEYYRKGNLTLSDAFNFHRKGNVGNYKNEMSDDDEKYIISKAESVMKIFHYL